MTEKTAKLVEYMDKIARCEELLDAICGGRDPEDLKQWEDESLVEIQQVERDTIAEYKKHRKEFLE